MFGRDLTPEVLANAVLFVMALVISTCFHEFGHAFVADKLGDRLARSEGRVTLNPLAHVDPWGTLLFPLLLSLSGAPVLGWGKPVRTRLQTYSLPRGMGLRTGHLLVSVAGPAMNLVLAMLLSGLFVLLYRAGRTDAASVCAGVIQLNIYLACFNLIPVPPLDGRSILFWFFPEDHVVVRTLDRYGMYLFIALLLLPSVLRTLMAPAGWLWGAWSHLLLSLVG